MAKINSMKGTPEAISTKAPELSPDDVRRIREKLGLSQVEAGELLGGGPRAFTKYESGTVKPAASIANLLRMLEANPAMLATLSGRKLPPLKSDSLKPLEVCGQHVAALSERKLVNLMRRLLVAEAQGGELPMDGIHVSAVITAPDGGEDASIKWAGGPDRTKCLPSRYCQFQLKAGDLTPAEAGAEVLTAKGEVKPMVREALGAGGTYILACGHSYTQSKLKAREDRIRKALTDAGLIVSAAQVQFRDADQLALWVNNHRPVAAWLLEQTQPGLVGAFRAWSHWAGRYDASPWIPDARFEPFREKLLSLAGIIHGVARVVGLSGYGKSRLVYESLGPTDDGATSLSDIVLYAVESEAGATAVKNIVQALADASTRAIIVVDRCTAETHQDLSAMVKRASSRLSLVTIDHEVPPGDRLPDDFLLVERAADNVIEGMIRTIAPKLPSEDQRRLVKFAQGFPQIANLLGQAWLKGAPIASASDNELFDRILFGRKPSDGALLKKAGMPLAAFALLGVKSPLKDLEAVASLDGSPSVSELRTSLAELIQRGVAQQHGRLVSLQPKPLAMALAEQQWRRWSEEQWDEILAKSFPLGLRKTAARQLALMNDRAVAIDVVRFVCRLNGPFASLAAFEEAGATEILSSLAEVDADSVLKLIDAVIGPLSRDERLAISGDARRHLVWALETIAFLGPTFEQAAVHLLDLAVAENEKWRNSASGPFKGLFPVTLSGTEAGPECRLRLLDELIRENDAVRMPFVVEALLSGASTLPHIRFVGPEIHGSRPALESWYPKLRKDYWDYITDCLDRLAQLGLRADSIGQRARTGMAQEFRGLVSAGLVNRIESWVDQIRAAHRYWPEALTALGDVLQYDADGLKAPDEARVRDLIAKLQPDDLADRVRFLVTEMPWDFPIDEKVGWADRQRRQIEAVENLARDVLEHPDELNELLPRLSSGPQRMGLAFGAAVAKFSAKPHEWVMPISRAVWEVSAKTRNFALISGFLSALAEQDAEAVEIFKCAAVNSDVFAPVFVIVCATIGITSSDIELACEGLRKGTIAPHLMEQWSFGGVLAKLPANAVVPLFDQMLAMDGDAYSVAVDLMGMYVHDDASRLEELRPQLVAVANGVHKRQKRYGSSMDAHNFEQIVGWLLSKGREDADARTVAGILAQHAAGDSKSTSDDLIKPLLPVMLSKFPALTWPIFGQAIVSDHARAWQLEHRLGDSFSFSEEKHPPILQVPEEILFAWCHAHPESAPTFLAGVLPVLTTRAEEAPNRAFHPVMKRLIDEFGDREDVLRKIVQNMHTFGWSGSRTTYYALYEKPLHSLEAHPIGTVRRWAKQMLGHMAAEIQSAKTEDDEQQARWGL